MHRSRIGAIWRGAGVGAILLATMPVAPAVAQDGSASVLIVTGEGRAAAAPDMATLRLGVVAEAETARAAISRMSESLRPVLAELTDRGVMPGDVQTGALSLVPVYGGEYGETEAAPRITGYEASSDVTVELSDPEGVGALLDAAIEAGANRIAGIGFGVAEPDALRDEALGRAVADARRKAEAMAAAAGGAVGPILEIREEGGAAAPGPVMEVRASSGVPTAAGEVDIRSSVTVRFSLEP